MDWAIKRKLMYLGTFLSIIAIIIGFFVYKLFFTIEPTCFDNKKNQDERGVDCGGVCELVCLTDTRPVVPLWTRPFKITGNVYSVLSFIENQNIGSGIKSITYQIQLLDEQNIPINEPIQGSTFIGPNERTAIFETAINTGDKVPISAFITLQENPIHYKTDPVFNTQSIRVSNEILSDLDTVPKLRVDITNITEKTFINFPVIVILYDEEGNALAVSQTIVDRLGLEETKKLFFSWPEPFSGTPTRREIIPRLNPFQ